MHPALLLHAILCAAFYLSPIQPASPAPPANTAPLHTDDAPPRDGLPVTALTPVGTLNVQATPDGSWRTGGGAVLISPTELLVPLTLIDSIAAARFARPCCEPLPITGVLWSDPASEMAVVRLAAPIDLDDITPARLADHAPAKGQTIHVSMAILKDVGTLSGSATVGDSVQWGSYGTRILAGIGFGGEGGGGIALDDSGSLVGMVMVTAGFRQCLVTPIPPSLTTALASTAFSSTAQPTPFPTFAQRTRTPAEERLRLSGQATAVPDTDLPASIAAWKSLLAADDGDWYGWWRLGVDLDKSGDSAKSLPALERSASLAPGFSEAWQSLGIVHYHRGEKREAKSAFEKAIAAEPGYASAHGMLGVVCLDEGDLDRAIEHSTKAHKLNPADYDAANNLCVMLEQAGHKDRCAAVWRTYTGRNPSDPAGWKRLHQYLDKEGALPERLAAAAKGHELDPDDKTLWLHYVIDLALSARPDDALSQIDQYLTRFPGDATGLNIKSRLTAGSR